MHTEQEVLDFILGRFRDLTAKLDIGVLSAETPIRELGLPSISVVIALAEIQDQFGLADELATSILSSGAPLDEQRLGTLCGYVMAALRARGS